MKFSLLILFLLSSAPTWSQEQTIQTNIETKSKETSQNDKYHISLLTGENSQGTWENKEYAITFETQELMGLQTGYQLNKSFRFDLELFQASGRSFLCAKEGVCAKIKSAYFQSSLLAYYFPIRYLSLILGTGMAATAFNVEGLNNSGYFFTYGLGGEYPLTRNLFLQAQIKEVNHTITNANGQMEEAMGLLYEKSRKSQSISIGLGLLF